MSSGGSWVRLHRGLLDSDVWTTDEAVFKTWIGILLSVNWKPGFFRSRRINSGEMVFSWRNLPERIHPEPTGRPSINKLRRHITKLEDLGMVSVAHESDRQFSILRVVNWSKYQANEVAGVSIVNTPTNTPMNTPTNTDIRKKRRERKCTAADAATAEWMLSALKEINPDHKQPNLDAWADVIRILRERDNRTDEEIRRLWALVRKDDFWGANVLCPATLRKRWDQLTIKLDRPAESFRPQPPKRAEVAESWM